MTLIIAGDFNVDFSRICNSSLLSDIISSLNLCAVDRHFHASISFTYMRDDGSASSWILCTDSLTPLFSTISLCDVGSILSDHQPLIAVFDYSLSAQLILPKSPRSSVNNNVSIAWDHVTSEHTQAYCEHISYFLPSPPLQALHCTNPNCTVHRQSLETYCKSLCKTMKDSAELHQLSRQGRIIPG